MGGCIAMPVAAVAAGLSGHNGTPTPAAKEAAIRKQNCAGCGAPIDPYRTACAYCRLPLFTQPPMRKA